MKQAFFLSGLGADERLFMKQAAASLPIKVIPWKIPLENESIEVYAKRMTEEIDQKDEVILGGVSFGGIIAMEMAKWIKTDKIILLSSVKTHREIPLHIKMWRYFPLFKVIPGSLIKKTGIMVRYIFGKMSMEEKKLFAEMVNDADPSFITWAMEQIVNWKNVEVPATAIHIHGTSDLIFPISGIKEPVVKISKGTHIMVITSSEEINSILKKELT